MNISFKDKVRSMSAAEIIMNMVNALENPIIKIRMLVFGGSLDNYCIGCASTASICNLIGKEIDKEHIKFRLTRAEFLNTDMNFLTGYELAIDGLRTANIDIYNYWAMVYGFAIIKSRDLILPILTDNYTREQLNCYIALANFQ